MTKVVWAMPSLRGARQESTIIGAIKDMYKTAGYPFELVVVQSNAERKKRILWRFGKRKVLKIGSVSNIGIPRAVNIVWKENAGPDTYLGYCADNFSSSKNWLKVYMWLFELEPAIGIIAANVPGLRRGNLKEYGVNNTDGIKWISSINFPTKAMLVRPEVVEKIGYLQEDYAEVGANDTDYQFRAALAGFDVAVIVDTVVFKRTGRDKGEYGKWKRQVNKESIARFQRYQREYESGKRSLYVKPGDWRGTK